MTQFSCETKKQMFLKASKAAQTSYSPYSNFRVGACLLCADGSMYVGCNIENSAYSATICAERSAFVQAINSGKRGFVAIAVVSPDADSPCFPCGECRQFMSEFCAEEFVVLTKDGEKTVETSLNELLPYSFSLKGRK